MKNMLVEFQAVIMAAGKGSRMTEITTNKPKCLLPVGNRPVIWYPLRMLENFGFHDVIIIILEHQKVDIQKVLDKYNLNIKIDYVCIQQTEDWGTADSLRFIYDRITRDLLVLSCDFVTNFNVNQAINILRKNDASLVLLLFNAIKFDNCRVPGPKTKQRPERDLIGIETSTNRLVFLKSSSDFEDIVYMPKRLLKKHSRVTIFSALLDSHFYIIKKWVLDFLINEKSFNTIKGELLPYIVKRQLSKQPPKNSTKEIKNGKQKDNIDEEIDDNILKFSVQSDLVNKIIATSMYNDHLYNSKSAYYGDFIKCYATIAPKDIFGIRVNNLQSYCILNQIVIQNWNKITLENELVRIHPNANVKSKQIDELSMIDEATTVSEKTSLQKTFIGTNCVIENKVRLTNCIIMQDVKINEGCVLTNCIVCDGAVIEKNVTLKDCLVGHGHIVNESHTSEFLTAIDRLMEI